MKSSLIKKTLRWANSQQKRNNTCFDPSHYLIPSEIIYQHNVKWAKFISPVVRRAWICQVSDYHLAWSQSKRSQHCEHSCWEQMKWWIKTDKTMIHLAKEAEMKFDVEIPQSTMMSWCLLEVELLSFFVPPSFVKIIDWCLSWTLLLIAGRTVVCSSLCGFHFTTTTTHFFWPMTWPTSLYSWWTRVKKGSMAVIPQQSPDRLMQRRNSRLEVRCRLTGFRYGAICVKWKRGKWCENGEHQSCPSEFWSCYGQPKNITVTDGKVAKWLYNWLIAFSLFTYTAAQNISFQFLPYWKVWSLYEKMISSEKVQVWIPHHFQGRIYGFNCSNSSSSHRNSNVHCVVM